MLDNHLEFASGLANENPQRNQTVRVFTQVHNRGVQAAANITVKVFFALGGLTFPDLPVGFWTNFPNNVLDPASPWQAVAPHTTIPAIDAGRSQIAGFEWPVPANAPNQVALLAIITAGNDSLATTERNIAALVTTEKKCGLRNVTVVNPPPQAGAPLLALPLRVGAKEGAMQISVDYGAVKLTRAVVLSNRLAQ